MTKYLGWARVHGVWQRSTEQPGTLEGFGAVGNLMGKRLEDLSPLMGRLGQGAAGIFIRRLPGSAEHVLLGVLYSLRPVNQVIHLSSSFKRERMRG